MRQQHDQQSRGEGEAHVSHDIRSLSFALAGTFVLRCASYGAGIIIPVSLGIKSKTDHDVTTWLASLIAVSFYAAELTGAPIFGVLSDRIGRKPFMLLGPLFGGIAIQMLGFTSIIPLLILVRVMEGFSTASSAPATLGYISAQTAGSDRLRGRVMGFYEAATVVGLAGGAALGGTLFDRVGSLSFTLMAVVYAIALVLFMFVRRHPSDHVRPARGTSVFRRLLNPGVMRFAPAWLAANAVLGAWLNLAPFLAAGQPDPAQFLMGGYDGVHIGAVFLLFGVTFTLGAIAWGFLMPRLGRQVTLLAGVGGLAFTTIILWILNNASGERPHPHIFAPGLAALIVVGIFVESGFTPAALAYLADIAEEHSEDRGAVMGVYSVLLSVGQLLGNAGAAPFAHAMGANGLILFTGLLCLVSGVTVVSLGMHERGSPAAARRVQTSPALE